MMDSEKLKFLILPVLNVWPRVRIVFNTTIPDLQNSIFASLERNHAVVLGCRLLTSGGIYEVERMGLLGKNSQSLRNPLLMELQDFLNVSDLNILIELVLIFLCIDLFQEEGCGKVD